SGVDEFPACPAADLEQALVRLAPLGAVLMAHCESPTALALVSPPESTRTYTAYAASRPAEAETEAVALLLSLAEKHRARVHVVHVSSAATVGLVAAARTRGVAVTAETCPHYLHFCTDDVPDGATEYKCAPPIRAAADRDALWRGLEGGALDLVVSDHSPCPPEMKARESGDFMAAWGGIASLQIGLRVVWTGMRARGLPLERLAAGRRPAPGGLGGLGPARAGFAPGCAAAFATGPPGRGAPGHAEETLCRHRLPPYVGARLAGVVESTWVRGRRVFSSDGGVAGA